MARWDVSCSQVLLHALFTCHSFQISTREVGVTNTIIIIIIFYIAMHCCHQSGAAVIVSILVALTVFVAEFLLRREAEKVDQPKDKDLY